MKVMWKHHMTSPNFGEIFKSIYQMVAVQKRGSKFMKDHFKRIKLMKKIIMQINPLIKKRGHTSPIMLLESFHLREKLTILKRRGVLKSKEKSRKIKKFISWQNFN